MTTYKVAYFIGSLAKDTSRAGTKNACFPRPADCLHVVAIPNAVSARARICASLPWVPSQPAMKSHVSSSTLPSLLRTWIFGWLVSRLFPGGPIGCTLGRTTRLKLVEPPIRVPAAEVKQIWHVRFENDHGHRWLRSILIDLFSDVKPKAVSARRV